MTLRRVRLYPDPVLRVRCPEVESFDEELRQLAADMVETMHAALGVGLAAPQVGVETRLMVVDVTGGDDESAVMILVNPEIEETGGEARDAEGCLSIPGFTEKVDRPTTIRVRARNLDGEVVDFIAEDLLARVICHELDHLNGILFVDHLRGLRRERAKRHLRRMRAEQHEAERERDALVT